MVYDYFAIQCCTIVCVNKIYRKPHKLRTYWSCRERNCGCITGSRFQQIVSSPIPFLIEANKYFYVLDFGILEFKTVLIRSLHNLVHAIARQQEIKEKCPCRDRRIIIPSNHQLIFDLHFHSSQPSTTPKNLLHHKTEITKHKQKSKID